MGQQLEFKFYKDVPETSDAQSLKDVFLPHEFTDELEDLSWLDIAYRNRWNGED